MRTVSEANVCEHWREKHKRHKAQQRWIWMYFKRETRDIPLPCTVHLIRHGKRILDSDNLPVSLKWVRDAVAACLIPGLPPGRADNDPRITWEYDQVVSTEYFVEIRFERE